MRAALVEARRAGARGEIPVGAVVVVGGRVVARAGNASIRPPDPTGHAEIRALRRAARRLGAYRLTDATLVVTLEPCLMCMGTAMSFFLGRLVYALPAPADGASSVSEQWRPALGHPTTGGAYALPMVEKGVGEAEARALIASWLDTGVSGGEADFARRTLG